VELSFDDHFELEETDADILIQISGGAVLWQKERLLNVAIQSVPPAVGHIARIDGDVIFERTNWMDEAQTQLKDFKVVQLFSDLVDLGPEDHYSNFDYQNIPASGRGIASSVSEGSRENLTCLGWGKTGVPSLGV
jgi:hypothetical protein